MKIERPKHGGDLASFCRDYGHLPEDCLDLSTGISPWAWPVPEIPQEVWQKLPGQFEPSQQLIQAAASYYGCSAKNILAVPGSQWSIQSVPGLLQPSEKDIVLLPDLGYEEHRYAWSQTAARSQFYSGFQSLLSKLQDPEVRFAVVINPNNPTGELVDPNELLFVARTLAERGGYLILDEAFADSYAIPSNQRNSLTSKAGQQGLLIFRSIGKFFGLPGLRLGFVLGEPGFLQQLRDLAGPWNINSAALWLGARMLSDIDWIEEQRSRLEIESEQMLHCIQRALPDFEWVVTGLFVSAIGSVEDIENLREGLGLQAILVRVFAVSEEESLIRIGLADADPRDRLSQAIGELTEDSQEQPGLNRVQPVPLKLTHSRADSI